MGTLANLIKNPRTGTDRAQGIGASAASGMERATSFARQLTDDHAGGASDIARRRQADKWWSAKASDSVRAGTHSPDKNPPEDEGEPTDQIARQATPFRKASSHPLPVGEGAKCLSKRGAATARGRHLVLGNAMADGNGFAIDAFFDLRDGSDRSKVARETAETLARCAVDCPYDENWALLTGFLEQIMELKGW